MKSTRLILAAVALASLPSTPVQGQSDQWPTHRKDTARSGYTETRIDAARLESQWVWRSEVPPAPAWDGPARWDAFAGLRQLPAMRGYDACFHPASDGRLLFFGSSSQDTLLALNLKTGRKSWSFVAGGPIRLAPTLWEGKIYFGCDDGFAYCLQADNGKLIWRFSPAEHAAAEQRRVINNDRLISFYPVRTGVLIRDGKAYFGAALLPWREAFLCCVDATTGAAEGPGTFVTRAPEATLEGSMLVAEDRLIVPQGRVAPLLFDRRTGKKLGNLPGGGGVTIVLTEDQEIVRTEGGGAARGGQVSVFSAKQRVATFPRGRSMVVRPDSLFVIDQEKLFAAKRMTNELLWQRIVDEPVQLVMAAEVLMVGGRDHVTAVNSRNGNVIWTAPVAGRAFGLAIAGGCLVVSTDQGAIHVFAATGSSPWQPQPATADSWSSPRILPVRENDLEHRWVFHRSGMKKSDDQIVSAQTIEQGTVRDQAGNADAQLVGGTADVTGIGENQSLEALVLKGSYFRLPEQSAAQLPDQAITVETWVRVDQAQPWGGLVGCFQDDGSTEHGWLLGYRDDRFSFALAGQGEGLTYLTASQGFQNGSWHHVAGTYDGQQMCLYLDGRLAALSDAESGSISYPASRSFSIGAYHDDNEHFPLVGALHEVRIYNAALGADLIRTHFAAKADSFPESTSVAGDASFISWGPVAHFVEPGVAEITYGTAKKTSTHVTLSSTQGVRDFHNNDESTRHSIRVDKIPIRRELQFQIKENLSDGARVSPGYVLDSHFDMSRVRPETSNPWAKKVLASSPSPRGLALVIGEPLFEKARDLALAGQMSVVLVVEPNQVTRLREACRADPQLRYAADISVIDGSLETLPAAFSALVIADQDTPELRRLVRPSGGVLWVNDQRIWTRETIPGAGQWSHMYGRADNSAFGGEELSQATTRQDLVAQWIGRPGPRYQTDRQNRKPSPLAIGGRLYLQGHQRLIALDSYSGSVLWTMESPTVMRWNVPRDSSNWCADEQHVFVAAGNQAWRITGPDGTIDHHYSLPVDRAVNRDLSWGYIARHDRFLVGSVVQSDAIFTNWWGGSNWYDSATGEHANVVAGDKLFALDWQSGDLVWDYDGLVLHPTVTILGDQIYFVEDRTQSHVDGDRRRLALDSQQQHVLVCLDLEDGKKRWETAIEQFSGPLACLYLAGGNSQDDQHLVLVASLPKQQLFTVQHINPLNGELGWEKQVPWEANHHGKHISRPAIQGGLLYLRPEVINIENGELLVRGFPGGHGCGSYVLCTQGLIGRLGTITWWDPRTEKVNRFPRLRTDCWISTIPAQGMLLSPEGGGGCSCGSWFETSLGFLPRSVDQQRPRK